MQKSKGVTGQDWLIRASPRLARPSPAACPTYLRNAMRPLLVADPPGPYRPDPLQEFPFGPLFAGLDLWEHENWPVERVIEELHTTRGQFRGSDAQAHPALLAWTADALARFVSAREREQAVAAEAGLPRTMPVRQPWTWRTHRAAIPDPRGVRQYEHTIWGRTYASADGTVRELWLPSLGRAKTSRPDAELAAVAQVMVQGVPTPRTRVRTPPPDTATPLVSPPQLVRVFDFGCADGHVKPLLSAGPAEARQRFEDHAAPAFRSAATGTGASPGESCVECKAVSGCAELKRTPGLWGGSPPERARKRRSLSAWDLRLYGACPAQYHLVRRLHLDDLSGEDRTARRGRVVDAWLDTVHAERPVRGCRDREAPDAATVRARTGVDEESAHEAAGMLAGHRLLCPLDGLGDDEQILVQHRVTAYVPELDVVVLAVPDLVYTHRGRWIWRETKTSVRPLKESASLLHTYPQLALGVLLIHAGALGGDPGRSLVELEHLREGRGHSRLERVDPGLAETVDEARDVIAEFAQPLLADTTYEPRTGRHCHDCQARTWCGPGTAYVTDHPRKAGPGGSPTRRGERPPHD
jgi:hypothetical protein